MSTTYFDEFVDPYATGSFVIRAEHYMRYVFAGKFLSELLQNGNVVYDIGCGNGYGRQVMVETSWNFTVRYIGFDNSSALLSATAQLENVSFFDHNFERDSLINFVNNEKIPKPDAVIAYEILEHLEDPEKLLRELYSLLPENGTLILSVPNEKYEPKKKGKPRNKFHKQLFSVERIIRLLNEAGFQTISIYGQPKANEFYHKSKLIVKVTDLIVNFFPSIFPFFSRKIAKLVMNTAGSSYSIIIHAEK